MHRMKLEELLHSTHLRQCYVNFFPLCSPGGSTIFDPDLPIVAIVKNPSILSWIQMLIRITTKIQSPLSWAKSNIPWQFQPNPPGTFCVILQTKKPPARQMPGIT